MECSDVKFHIDRMSICLSRISHACIGSRVCTAESQDLDRWTEVQQGNLQTAALPQTQAGFCP